MKGQMPEGQEMKTTASYATDPALDALYAPMRADRLQRGYEFVDGRPVLRPSYDYERLREMAGPADENGYAEVTVEVPEGETAWNPGSTKHVIHGPVKLRYEFWPEGVRGIVL